MLFCVRGSTNKSKNSKNTYFSFILHKPAENLLAVLMTLTMCQHISHIALSEHLAILDR